MRERGTGGERDALLATPIAHRGLHLGPDAPENSLAAFRLAIEHGFPIELDVHLLADGEAAVFHDASLLRMTGCDALIENVTSTKLKTLHLLNTAESVPLLGDVLDLIAGKVPLLVELKSHAPRVGALERAVLERLKPYRGDYAIQSFNWRSVAWFRRTAPAILRGQLSSGDDGVSFAHLTEPDFVAYQLGALPRPLPKALRERGVPLIAWTVRTTEEREKARGVAGNFIFDASEELLAAIVAADFRPRKKM